MSAVPDATPAHRQPHATSYAMGHSFDFVRAAIEVPGLLDLFPDAGTAVFREFWPSVVGTVNPTTGAVPVPASPSGTGSE